MIDAFELNKTSDVRRTVEAVLQRALEMLAGKTRQAIDVIAADRVVRGPVSSFGVVLTVAQGGTCLGDSHVRVVLEAEGSVCDGSCAVVTAILNGSLELLAGDVAGAGGVDVGNRKQL